MIMRSLLLFLVCFFNAFLALPVDHYRTIAWHPTNSGTSSKIRTIDLFEGAVLIKGSKLPYWIENFELQSTNAEVTITNTAFEPFNDQSIDLPDSITTDVKFSTFIGTSAGKSFLRVSILPFVKRNDQIFKLAHFTLSVIENSNSTKSATAGYTWKSTSVLGSGKWVKIKTKNKGIYKITFDQLIQWGFANPDSVWMYGNGGYMLPVLNKDLNADDLLAYPVWKGKDNTNKNCLFFYSSGNIQLNRDIETGMFSHQQNYYSTETYFYLSDKRAPLLIEKPAALTESAGRRVYTYPNYTFYEKELVNLISSGSQWFGEGFKQGSSQTFNLTLENPDLTQAVFFTVAVAGKSSDSSDLDVTVNGKLLGNISFGILGTNDTDYALDKISNFSQILSAKNISMKLIYNATNSLSAAWLDYISVNYQSFLNMSSDVVFFRGKGVDGTTPISEFVLTGGTSGTKILNVTDLHHVVEMPVTNTDGLLSFKSNSSLMNEYVAFNPTGTIPTPDLVGEIPNQNLHASDLTEMIIVTNSSLLIAANKLADIHRTTDQMTVKVVTPDLIYNEFSGGLPDPAGLRNYFRMCYDRGKQSGKNTLKYILLMGDGSYDNRNILGKNLNLIPTFQSDNSLSPTESFVTDDFFVFLDENEGVYSGIIDLGIGRIPANNLTDAQAVVAKVKNYQLKETIGNWRNMVTFIADDGNKDDGYTNIHMQQAEDMANYLNKTYPSFYTDKIYFDTYKRVTSAGDAKYPDVTAAINSRIKRGTLIMNYTGHANERNLADETVLDIGTIDSWSNINQLPIFVTATCEYSRFDANETSAGEHILFNPSGGGIGLFSTTRLVYSGANAVLNSKFYEYVFSKDQLGNNRRLGEVMRLAKAAANTGNNQLNFTLLADPALRLAYPNLQIKTTSIDGKNAVTNVDTIRSLSVVNVKGFIADNNGAKLTSFNGEIVPTVYDKAIQVKTLGNAGQEPMNYTSQSNIIYKGLASVTNGEFEFSFFVPKDISYKFDKGRILYYAYNETTDAQGYFNDFYVGGFSNNTISDSQGPSIDLFLNSNSFKDGGEVSASSVLLANISDNTGINTAGTGIGHDITAVLDGDYSNIMVLNDYFQASKDKYTEGMIVFPLTKLAEGNHTLKIKVWDVLNNSSEKEIHFVVKDNFRIESVQCYPNPMQEQTSFVFKHNQPDESFNVTLEVFQTSGTRIDMLQTTIGSNGTESLPLEWTPSSRLIKMKTGIYIYRISVTTRDGKLSSGSGSGRLVFVNH
jgi:hypothetical protein